MSVSVIDREFNDAVIRFPLRVSLLNDCNSGALDCVARLCYGCIFHSINHSFLNQISQRLVGLCNLYVVAPPLFCHYA